MKRKVLSIVARIMGVPVKSMTEKSSIDTVEEWDSLKHMNLILALEEEFKVQFSDEDIVEMLSVELIFETLKGLIND